MSFPEVIMEQKNSTGASQDAIFPFGEANKSYLKGVYLSSNSQWWGDAQSIFSSPRRDVHPDPGTCIRTEKTRYRYSGE
jgi:hypothetical protein